MRRIQKREHGHRDDASLCVPAPEAILLADKRGASHDGGTRGIRQVGHGRAGGGEVRAAGANTQKETAVDDPREAKVKPPEQAGLDMSLGELGWWPPLILPKAGQQREPTPRTSLPSERGFGSETAGDGSHNLRIQKGTAAETQSLIGKRAGRKPNLPKMGRTCPESVNCAENESNLLNNRSSLPKISETAPESARELLEHARNCPNTPKLGSPKIGRSRPRQRQHRRKLVEIAPSRSKTPNTGGHCSRTGRMCPSQPISGQTSIDAQQCELRGPDRVGNLLAAGAKSARLPECPGPQPAHLSPTQGGLWVPGAAAASAVKVELRQTTGGAPG